MSPRSVIWRTPRDRAASSASRNGPSSPGRRPPWQSAKTARMRRNDSSTEIRAFSRLSSRMPYRAAAALLALFLAARQPAAALAARSLSPPKAPRADASVRRALERGDDTLDVIVGLREEPAASASATRETEAAPRREAQRRAERLKRERSILDALPPGA